jgi:hypothetical protein
MLFKLRKMDEACVQTHYLENLGHEKGNPSGSKQKEHQEDSKEGKKKWKGGKDTKMVETAHKYKDPSDH